MFETQQCNLHRHSCRLNLRHPPPAEDRGLHARGRQHKTHHLLHRVRPSVYPHHELLQSGLGGKTFGLNSHPFGMGSVQKSRSFFLTLIFIKWSNLLEQPL